MESAEDVSAHWEKIGGIFNFQEIINCSIVNYQKPPDKSQAAFVGGVFVTFSALT